jgi:tetratricopeptide (TPR) repeat protein
LLRQIAFALTVLILSPLAAGGQSKPGRKPPAAAVPLEELILQSKTPEALRLASRSANSVPNAMKAILAQADGDVTEQRPDAAAAKLESLSRFLDAYAKANKGKDVARDGLRGRQLRIEGIQLSARREFAKAEPMLRQALELARKSGDAFLESGVHNNLGYTLLSRAETEDENVDQRLEEAAKEFETARSMAEAQGDTFRAGSYNLNLGQTLMHLRRYDPAMTAFRRAAGHFRTASKPSLEGRALLYQGIALDKLNLVSQEPLKLYDQAFKMFDKLGESGYAGWSLYLIAEHLAYNQKFAEAAQTAERAVPLLVKGGTKERLRGCYFLLSEAYTRLRETAKAERYRQLMAELDAPHQH